MVSIVPCESYDYSLVRSALISALESIGGLDFVEAGMTVAVKVNLVSPMAPERAATVHPALVCALTELLRERGAEVIIGDSPGGVFRAAYLKHVYEQCGMTKAEEFGARLNDDFSQAEIENPDAVQAKRFTATAWLRNADVIIDLCKLKSHGMMGMTCAVKNFFGTIPGTRKPEYHYRYPKAEDFADVLVDLYEYWKPRLCICDAVIAMEGNGPTQGTPRPIGCLLAAQSGHELDAVAAELIGLDIKSVPTLAAAQRRGLIGSREAISTAGSPADFAVKDFKTVPAQGSVVFLLLGDGPIGRLADKAARGIMTPRPQVTGRECIGCGKCASICPARAITMEGRRPRIDRNQCIHCFCCQEFCPVGAMKAHRNIIMRVLGK